MEKHKLEKMTIKELIKFLNNCVTDITYTSTNTSSVKKAMFERIKDVFSPEFSLRSTNYIHHDFMIPINRLGVYIKIGTKSTGKIEKITKLKSKYVLGVGKFKLDFITFGYSLPCFHIKDKNKFIVEIDNSSGRGSEGVSISNSSTKTFQEMNHPESVLEAILDNYKLVEATNKKYNQKNKVFKSLEEEIGLMAAQPFIKEAWGGNKEKELIKLFPKDLQTKIKNDEINWFDATIGLVMVNNTELIQEIKRNILNGKT
jgi:hypothetical protein